MIATRQRLAQFDNELERWTHDLEMYRARKVSVLKLKYDTLDMLKEQTLKQTHARSVAQDENGAAVNTNPSGAQISGSSEAIAALNKQLNAAVSDPTIQKRLIDLGATPMPPTTPAELGKMMADDYAKWVKVIKSAGIKPQ